MCTFCELAPTRRAHGPPSFDYNPDVHDMMSRRSLLEKRCLLSYGSGSMMGPEWSRHSFRQSDIYVHFALKRVSRPCFFVLLFCQLHWAHNLSINKVIAILNYCYRQLACRLQNSGLLVKPRSRVLPYRFTNPSQIHILPPTKIKKPNSYTPPYHNRSFKSYLKTFYIIYIL